MAAHLAWLGLTRVTSKLKTHKELSAPQHASADMPCARPGGIKTHRSKWGEGVTDAVMAVTSGGLGVYEQRWRHQRDQ